MVWHSIVCNSSFLPTVLSHFSIDRATSFVLTFVMEETYFGNFPNPQNQSHFKVEKYSVTMALLFFGGGRENV